jgi:two-component system response regulator FixJ
MTDTSFPPAPDPADRPSDDDDGYRSPIDVILIEDDRALLELLKLELEAAGFVVHAFADPLDALMFASDAEPCCLVSDLMIPGVEGLDLIAALRALDRHVVILVSAYVDVSTTVDAMRLGVDDVILKPVTGAKLRESITRASRLLARRVTQDFGAFTRRERQVADGLVAGRTTKQIAQDLNLSPRTVEFFRASLLRKTQSRNTAGLVAALMRVGYRQTGQS